MSSNYSQIYRLLWLYAKQNFGIVKPARWLRLGHWQNLIFHTVLLPGVENVVKQLREHRLNDGIHLAAIWSYDTVRTIRIHSAKQLVQKEKKQDNDEKQQ